MTHHSTIESPQKYLSVLPTGQTMCFSKDGSAIPCEGTGQDGEYTTHLLWPEERFTVSAICVHDAYTGLWWTRDAVPEIYALTWAESLDAVEAMNARAYGGRTDWRMPDRRELHSLTSFAQSRPALPLGHPFGNVFSGWYWSSTSYAHDTDYAWRVHMEGGRMFYGRKDEYSLLWPVAGESPVLAATGQRVSYDPQHRDRQHDVVLPRPRYLSEDNTVLDTLTGLRWLQSADLCGPVAWESAFTHVATLRSTSSGYPWRLPTIRELESLTDAAESFPALAEGHPFQDVGNEYWSSTSSSFAYDWAMVLYLGKGAVGVGYKQGDPFLVWPVCG